MDPAIERPAKKSHPWLLIIGGVLALIALLLCGVGGIGTFSQVKGIADATPITGAHTGQVEDGESLSVWSEAEADVCTATGPDGDSVGNTAMGTQSFSWGDREVHRVMKVEAAQTGDHTITCSLPFVVGDGIFVGGIVLAVIGGGLGLLAVVPIGIWLSLWLVRRGR